MTANTAALADAYAALKHEEDAIKARVSAMRDEILAAATNTNELVGDVVVVQIIEKKGAETLDKSAALFLLKQLGATPEQIAELTKVGKPSKSLNIKPKMVLAV